MEPCQHIGPHQAETGHGKEEGFTQFVRAQGLFLPATFSACHVSSGGTWLHPQGSWCRSDFIGLPVEWHFDSCTSWISDDIEVGLPKEDQKAAGVQFSRHTQVGTSSRRRHPLKLRLADISPGDLPQLGRHAWNIDAHTHAQKLQDDLLDAFWDKKAPPIMRPIKTTMPEATWDLVCQKRSARHDLQQHSQVQRCTLLSAWFACWKYLHVTDDQEGLCPLLCSFDEMLSQQDGIIALAFQQFRTLGRQVVRQLRRDDILFYDNNLLQESQAFPSTSGKL